MREGAQRAPRIGARGRLAPGVCKRAPRERHVAFAALSIGSAALLGCFRHAELPDGPIAPAGLGRAPSGFQADSACGAWGRAIAGDDAASSHAAFPERVPSACFVPVRYAREIPRPDPTPAGCGFPTEDGDRARAAEQARYERIAASPADTADLPPDLACALAPEVRAVAARTNAAAIAAARRDRAAGKRYPYAVAATFGFGHRDQGAIALAGWRPGDACRALARSDLDALAVNVTRAGRAAMALQAGVAPLIVVSGGAVHSPLIEAFALAHIVTCKFHVPADRVMVDPCADHTHTNMKHTASLTIALGGRTAYVVTDDGLQSGYLEEWTLFDLIGGSVDQRALRDWGYLLGSWRRASVGMRAGFWMTPYRFWDDPEAALRSLACTR